MALKAVVQQDLGGTEPTGLAAPHAASLGTPGQPTVSWLLPMPPVYGWRSSDEGSRISFQRHLGCLFGRCCYGVSRSPVFAPSYIASPLPSGLESRDQPSGLSIAPTVPSCCPAQTTKVLCELSALPPAVSPVSVRGGVAGYAYPTRSFLNGPARNRHHRGRCDELVRWDTTCARSFSPLPSGEPASRRWDFLRPSSACSRGC